MSQINICDRCRKELSDRRTLVGVKPRGSNVSVNVFKFSPFGIRPQNNNLGSHSFELCDDCANRLAEFLKYGPSEGSTEEN